MLPPPEVEMGFDFTSHVEAVGFGILPEIAGAGRVDDHDSPVLWNDLAMELNVTGERASLVLRRGVKTEDFVHGSGDERGVIEQALKSLAA